MQGAKVLESNGSNRALLAAGVAWHASKSRQKWSSITEQHTAKLAAPPHDMPLNASLQQAAMPEYLALVLQELKTVLGNPSRRCKRSSHSTVITHSHCLREAS
jgi:hypothetical protein